MYRSEAEFVAALLPLLRKYGMVQRIESPDTSRGIPDIYWRTSQREYWIEAKNMTRASVVETSMPVSWRAGQQAWALEYRRASGLHTYTVCAVKDGFIVIPMVKHFPKDIVTINDMWRMTTLKDIVEVLLNEKEAHQ